MESFLMEGLAKSAPSPQPIISNDHTTPQMVSEPSWQGVPMDIYKFMNVDFFDSSEKHQTELREIYEYAKAKSNGMPGDTIQKIEELQHKLGEPPIGTSRLAQLTNYIRINRNISDLLKQKRVLEKNSWR
jgi:hypothetical protein